MKDAIDLFSNLGQRLRGFGSEARSRQAIAEACAENPWFSPDDVRRAVAALVDDMLDRDRLTRWLARYPELPVAKPRNVLVIMAGNLPLVGFFDLLCVVAAGHRCLVKPSAKDRVLIGYVLELLREIDPSVPVSIYDGGNSVEAVIATGSDNAVRYFRERYAAIPALLRGSRQSVAVLSGRETPEQLRGLADDIWAYAGLGCRNVSLIFVPEGVEPKLHATTTNIKYRNNYIQQHALMSMQRREFVDLGGALLVEQREFPAALSVIACARYRSIDEVREWLLAHDNELQCVVSECVDHSRRVGFGQAQHPALEDYPDDCDVMAWLARPGIDAASANGVL